MKKTRFLLKHDVLKENQLKEVQMKKCGALTQSRTKTAIAQFRPSKFLAYFVMSIILLVGNAANAQNYRTVWLRTANGPIITAEKGGGGAIYGDSSYAGAWQMFRLHDQNGGEVESDDIVQLQAWNGLYLCAEGGGGSVINANRTSASGWEAFRIRSRRGKGIITPDDQICLISLNGNYLGVDWANGTRLMADSWRWGDWESFYMTVGNAVIPRNLQWPIPARRKGNGYIFGSDWTVGSKGRDGHWKCHNGWDIGGTTSDSIYAAEAGVIKHIGTDSTGWGKWMVIEHRDFQGHEYTTLYFHVNPLSTIRIGSFVSRGQRIATLWNLGGNTHLDFSIRNAPFDTGWFNYGYRGAASAANRGALPRTSSYSDGSGWNPKFPEFFVDPGIYVASP